MAASPARVVQQHLINSDVVIMPGISQSRFSGKFQCFHPSMADDIDNGVVVKDTKGSNQGRIHRDGKHLEHYGIDVIIRSNTEIGYDILNSILTVLDSVKNTVVRVDGLDYTLNSVYRIGTPGYAGEEEQKQRYYWTVGCRVVMEKTGTVPEE